jgi:hypothetical protein
MVNSALILGHSHLACLGVPQAPRAGSKPFTPYIKTLGAGPISLSAMPYQAPEDETLPMLDAIAGRSEGAALVMLWQGNLHYIKFLLVERPPFDFVLSTEPDRPLERDCCLEAESLVEESLSAAGAELDGWLRSVRAAAPRLERLVVAATPPPKGDDEFIKARLSLEFDDNDLAALRENEGSVTICPRGVRYKLWALLMRIYRSVAIENGADFLGLPPNCQDGEGFLAPEFYGADVTHANARYGAYFRDHLLAYLSGANDDATSLQNPT